MAKCLVIALCVCSLITIVFCAPGYENREKRSTRQDVTDQFKTNGASRTRRQNLDTVDIVYIDASALDTTKLQTLQNKESSRLAPVNDQTDMNIRQIFQQPPETNTEFVTQNRDYVVYKLKDTSDIPANSVSDEKTTLASSDNYNYDSEQFGYSDEKRPPPPPPPDGDDPPPPPPHHHPPPPPPHHHPPPPPPPHHYPPPPPHHHHPPLPPPPDDYRSNYYDRYDSYYQRRPPPPPPRDDDRSRKFYDDRQTRQSPYDRPPPPRRDWPPQQYGRPPGGPPPRGPPPHRGGPPDRYDRGPPDRYDRGPPDRYDRGPPDRYDRGPPDRFDRRPPDRPRGPPDQYNRGPPDRRPPPDRDQWKDNENNKYTQYDNNPAYTSSTTEAVTQDNQYDIDIRFNDDDRTQQTAAAIHSQNPKRDITTKRPLSPFLFQATPVTPED
ncbi:formin-like protein 14 [Helicoverpa zea]|uniref:formin-like protein 14 n=1 Tax=Helicoverpa zea TaxID=7113 RepID=UPI001F56B7EE|nr:formin-like protein 14 [Helicoverpa zea]